MTVKVELSAEVQAGLLAQAQQNGLSLEAYIEQVLRERSREAAFPALTRSQIAGRRIRELRKGVSLGGIPVKLRSLSKRAVSEFVLDASLQRS
jgi:hypothetical protein